MEELVDAHEELRNVGYDPGAVAEHEGHHHEDGSAGEPGVALPVYNDDNGTWQTRVQGDKSTRDTDYVDIKMRVASSI